MSIAKVSNSWERVEGDWEEEGFILTNDFSFFVADRMSESLALASPNVDAMEP